MKLVLVAGARPQFIKAAALLPALRARAQVTFLHTGQHFDRAMVEAHFTGLELPEPDIRLGGLGADLVPHLSGADVVIVMGDTNSTLLGARGARAAGIRLAHVEAGARSGEPDLPEEKIRIEVDGLSDVFFCSTAAHARNLIEEGRPVDAVHVVGDVMADVLLAHRAALRSPRTDEYLVLTMHRAGAADDPAAVGRVLDAAASAGFPVVFPKHPRTRLPEGALPRGVELCEPMPYLDFMGLVLGARAVLTDSGGLQKEAYLLGTPCLTLREATEWGETVEAVRNVLVGTDAARIRDALQNPPRADGPPQPELYGSGDAAPRIAALL